MSFSNIEQTDIFEQNGDVVIEGLINLKNATNISTNPRPQYLNNLLINLCSNNSLISRLQQLLSIGWLDIQVEVLSIFENLSYSPNSNNLCYQDLIPLENIIKIKSLKALMGLSRYQPHNTISNLKLNITNAIGIDYLVRVSRSTNNQELKEVIIEWIFGYTLVENDISIIFTYIDFLRESVIYGNVHIVKNALSCFYYLSSINYSVIKYIINDMIPFLLYHQFNSVEGIGIQTQRILENSEFFYDIKEEGSFQTILDSYKLQF